MLPLKVTSLVSKFKEDTTSVVALAGTFKLNDPSAFVCAPTPDPFTRILAAANGEPSFALVTFPVTVRSCAIDGKQKTVSIISIATSAFLMFIELQFQFE